MNKITLGQNSKLEIENAQSVLQVITQHISFKSEFCVTCPPEAAEIDQL